MFSSFDVLGVLCLMYFWPFLIISLQEINFSVARLNTIYIYKNSQYLNKDIVRPAIQENIPIWKQWFKIMTKTITLRLILP